LREKTLIDSRRAETAGALPKQEETSPRQLQLKEQLFSVPIRKQKEAMDRDE